MSWSVEQIEQEILLTGLDALAISPGEVVSAFQRVERVLGSEWLGSISAKGIAPTTQVVGMGLSLAALDGVPRAETLIEHLRRRDQNAIAELDAIYILRRANDQEASVELQPEVGRRRADFRIRQGEGPWTYVEVTQPMASEGEKRVSRVLNTLTSALRSAEPQFVLHICLLREPTEREVAVLCDRLLEFCKLPGPQRATLIDGMGYLFLSQTDVGTLLFPQVPELTGKPKIGLAMFTGGGPHGGPHHQVSVAIPFTDKRCDKILKSEARQLPRDGPALIMMGVSDSEGNFDAWSSLVMGRFQPAIHTRVCGVILFSAGWRQTSQGYDFRPEVRLLTNPHASCRLPEWVHVVS